MKKIFFFVAALAVSLSMSAQKQMHVWVNGNAINIPISQVDSVTFTDLNTSEPNIPDPNPTPDPNTAGGIGVFSVAEGKTISFAPGNLQFNAVQGSHLRADSIVAKGTWRFAENQWDFVGNNNENIGENYDGWIDLFGWGTGANPINSSWDEDDYQTFVDWGTNQIGNDAPNTWRTLSKDEWEYLLNGRNNATSLCGVAQVNGVNGLIFLPDNWTCPAGVIFKSGFHSSSGVDYYAAHQTFTADQWSKLEAAGAVFLPAAGCRHGADTYSEQYFGRYWSATEYSKMCPYEFRIFADRAHVDNRDYRYSGQSVRLVKDVTTNETPDIPEEPTTPSTGIGVFSVAGGKQVAFSPGNLQYIRSAKEWIFAKNQYDIIGLNNIENNQFNDTIDLFGWSADNNDYPWGICIGMGDNHYYGNFVDWGKNEISGHTPNTWYTLCTSEWRYLFFTRKNAALLFGFGNINGVNGCIILPDNWILPSHITFTPAVTMGLILDNTSSMSEKWFYSNNSSYYNHFQHNTYSIEEWNIMEEAGAVFIPAGGNRVGTSISTSIGVYWANTYDGADNYAEYMFYTANSLYPTASHRRSYGCNVRLVKRI